jgi:membrane-associated phospholipid phosphatase
MFLKSVEDKNILIKHLLKVNVLSLGLAVLCMFFVDQSVSQYFGRPEVLAHRQWARDLTDAGLSQHYFIAAILLYIYFRWLAPHVKVWQKFPRKAEFFKKWALNLFVALITSGILVNLLKIVVGRQRPHKSAPIFDPFVFKPFIAHWHWHSFPSGHSQTMFAVATMMTLAFPRLKWLWIFFATLICFTRVVVHDHFVSDTIYGACVGYSGALIGLYLMKRYTRQGL